MKHFILIIGFTTVTKNYITMKMKKNKNKCDFFSGVGGGHKRIDARIEQKEENV